MKSFIHIHHDKTQGRYWFNLLSGVFAVGFKRWRVDRFMLFKRYWYDSFYGWL